MTLKKGILWSQKKMRPQNVRIAGKLNPIMQNVLSNKRIARTLDQPRERKEFFGMIKSVSKEGVYKKELRKLFGDLRSGKVRSRTINAKEIRIIAKEMFPDSARRYEFSTSKPSKNTNQNTFSKKAGFRTFEPSSKSAGYATTRPNPEPKAAITPANNPSITAIRIATAKIQPTKEPEKKEPSDIKPVAPEAYGKKPGDPQKVVKTAEKKETNLEKSMGQSPEVAENSSAPEERKKESAKPLSPENKEKLEFPKSTLLGSTNQVSNEKSSLIEPKSDILSFNDISPNKDIRTEALKKSARRRMLAARENKGSENSKRGFFGAMAATTKKRQS